MVHNNKNIKLGVMVVAGLSLFIMTLYVIGKSRDLFGSTFELKARFRNLQGLAKGDNVRFSGLQAGTVKSIELLDDTTIEVGMLIEMAMRPYIHKDAHVYIGSEGLIGNRIINIVAGNEAAPGAEPGDLLQTRKAVNPDEMLQTFSRINNNVEDISVEMKRTITRFNSSSALWDVLDDRRLVVNLNTTLMNIRQATAAIDATAGDLHNIVRDVRQGKGSIGSLLMDTAFASDLKASLISIRATSDTAELIAQKLDRTVATIQGQLDHGNGPLSALLKDSGMTKKMNAILTNTQQGTAAFSQDMVALQHNFLLRGYFRRQQKSQKGQVDSVAPKIADTQASSPRPVDH